MIFIASAKNTLTHSILGKPEIKRPEDLKGRKLGLTRLGSNSHYFVIQALRKHGMEPTDLSFIQTGGQVENLAALLSGAVDAATMTGPSGGSAGQLPGISLCRLWPGPPYPLCCRDPGDPALLDTHTRARHR